MNLTLSFEVTSTQPVRSRLMDSFNYVMGLIESEPYPFKHKLQIEISSLPQVHILDQEKSQSGFYQDEYALGKG
ncbi:MAG: hypothetical protein ABIQ02_10660 [Saprospiraceae bacterium]